MSSFDPGRTEEQGGGREGEWVGKGGRMGGKRDY